MSTQTPIIAIGRRKTATARVRMTPAAKTSVTVNGKEADIYFKTVDRSNVPLESLKVFDESVGNFTIEAKVAGGGISAQADAVRHAIARALTKLEPAHRTPLKRAGLLTRDPRAKERKKPGLKKARKAPQWSKR